MNTKYLALLIFTFLAGFFYINGHLQKAYDEVHYGSKQLVDEKIAIIEQGDTNAYENYIDSVSENKLIPRSNSFYYSFVMAISYNYSTANYDACKTIMAVYPDKDTMDVNTKKLCVFLLKRGADRNDKRCIRKPEFHFIDY